MRYLEAVAQQPPALCLEVVEEALVCSAFDVFLVRVNHLAAPVERFKLNRPKSIAAPVRVNHPGVATNPGPQPIRVVPGPSYFPLITMLDRLLRRAVNIFYGRSVPVFRVRHYHAVTQHKGVAILAK